MTIIDGAVVSNISACLNFWVSGKSIRKQSSVNGHGISEHGNRLGGGGWGWHFVFHFPSCLASLVTNGLMQVAKIIEMEEKSTLLTYSCRYNISAFCLDEKSAKWKFWGQRTRASPWLSLWKQTWIWVHF